MNYYLLQSCPEYTDPTVVDCYDQVRCNNLYDEAGRNSYYDKAGRIGILLRILRVGGLNI